MSYEHVCIDYIAFGPHGPREPIHKEGNAVKVLGGVSAVLAVSYALFYWASVNGKQSVGVKGCSLTPVPAFFFFISVGQEVPITRTKEWEEATNEYLKSQNSNPISGVSSEGYKGSGYVSSV